jgi:hypothetical protein
MDLEDVISKKAFSHRQEPFVFGNKSEHQTKCLFSNVRNPATRKES